MPTRIAWRSLRVVFGHHLGTNEEMSQPQLLTVVVPVYNEAATLRTSVERLLKARLPLPVEIVVVDDGSTDGGVETISDLVTSGNIHLVRHNRNRGKGAAVRTGIAHATGDVLTISDADLEYYPDDYARLLDPILHGEANVAFGTRSFSSHTAYSFWYVVGNSFLSLWTSLLFNAWLTDIETCYKVAKTDLWRTIEIRSRGFGIEPEVTAKFLRARERIFEVPIRYRARGREEGKKLRWTDGLKALGILLRIRIFGF
jgi:glycosyltransferase involved in cell wall biosynthesis